MYSLDTNVLSVISPTKTQPDRELQAWIRRNSNHLFLSVVTLLELAHVLTWLQRRKATAKVSRLEAWMNLVCFYYRARILPVDVPVAPLAGALKWLMIIK